MVSIIVPVWNRADLTHSFLFRLHQFYSNQDIEVIVVDNGSTDHTQRVLKSIKWPNLKIITNEKNTGFGPGNNQGAAFASGDILIFISNDVIINGDFVSIIKAALEKEPDVLAGPQLMTTDTGWNKFGGEVLPYIYAWCFFCKKETWQKLGGFDERYVPCDFEDLDLALTASKKGIELREIKLPLEHISGQSAEKLEGGRLQHTLRNQQLFKEKWGFV